MRAAIATLSKTISTHFSSTCSKCVFVCVFSLTGSCVLVCGPLLCALLSNKCMSSLPLQTACCIPLLCVHLSLVYSFIHPSLYLTLRSICLSHCPVEDGLNNEQKRPKILFFCFTYDRCITLHVFFSIFSCFFLFFRSDGVNLSCLLSVNM